MGVFLRISVVSEILKAIEGTASEYLLGYSSIKQWCQNLVMDKQLLAIGTCVEGLCQRQMMNMLKM